MQLQKNKMSMEFQVKKVLNGLPERCHEKQIEENARAMEFGPFTPKQMKEIDMLLGNK